MDELPDFPHPVTYRDWNGLQLAHVDTGERDRPAVLFVHGEPTWSYLWRKVIGPVHAAGYRCIAPDLPGFGRSDKPDDIGWYTYDRHTDALASLVDGLELDDATIVVHDWGGPIGLRVYTGRPDVFGRAVILDTGLFTGHQKMSDAWMAFRNFVESTEDLPIGMLVRGGCHVDPGDAIIANYDAPFAGQSKAGARAFPLAIPMTPDAPDAVTGQRVLDALRDDARPTLLLWGEQDPVIPPETGRRFADAIGADEPEIIAGAGHFLQEDAGEEIGRRIATWLSAR
jgi:haloalkane dehalogenase